MKIKKITIVDVEYVAYGLAKKLMEWDEPIPDFGTRYPNILESCLKVPFQTFDGKVLYKGFVQKAAVLFYLMIKNHPFQNGNKRIAVTTLLLFLADNNSWIKVDNQELYNFAKWVAGSSPKVRASTIQAIEQFISVHIVSVPE
ncbi:MAG: Death-on-curing family protein [Candidatus Yanofskybacteria bacterium GW2011_GWA1_39_13]|uniref:Death-on-curing family protein n=1 Tax=Yanofskybacteria sp. (strain GW2011_GWA1_39_13) TaxID=1619019 RepID=A0A0G0PVX3_YANXG|nr:MAG: Death-on-curing family protein [Candidatus Yanofskybacteria bacterium GW2011_GWA1_39_13]